VLLSLLLFVLNQKINNNNNNTLYSFIPKLLIWQQISFCSTLFIYSNKNNKTLFL